MKRVFIGLALLNLAVLLWFSVGSADVPEPVPAPQPTISLLDELPQPPVEQNNVLATPEVEPEQTTQVVVEEEAVANTVVFAPEEPEVEQIPEPEPTETELVAEAEVVVEAPPPKREFACYTFSLSELEEEVQLLAMQLSDVVERSNVRQKQREQIAGYRVLSPKYSLAQGAEQTRRLKKAGVRDIWHMRKGELAGHIALGLFSERGNALKRQKFIAAKGFEALIVPKYSQRPEYALDVMIEPALLSFEELKSMTQAHAGEWQKSACEVIAKP